MTDAELYAAAMEAAGESARGLSRRVLQVDERTGRRWLAGEGMPGPARQLCRALVLVPGLAELLREPDDGDTA